MCVAGDRLFPPCLPSDEARDWDEGICLRCNDRVPFFSPKGCEGAELHLWLLGSFHFLHIMRANATLSHTQARGIQTSFFFVSFLKRRLSDAVLTTYVLSHLIFAIRLLFTSEDTYLKITIKLLHSS